jgi:hypothetical protein
MYNQEAKNARRSKRSYFAENGAFGVVKIQHFFVDLLFLEHFLYASHCQIGISGGLRHSKKIIPKNLP